MPSNYRPFCFRPTKHSASVQLISFTPGKKRGTSQYPASACGRGGPSPFLPIATIRVFTFRLITTGQVAPSIHSNKTNFITLVSFTIFSISLYINSCQSSFLSDGGNFSDRGVL